MLLPTGERHTTFSSPWALPEMTTSFINRKLRALKKSKKAPNAFTLVELMTSVVIVGVLAATALPSFLNQTAKAKGAEATTQMSAIFKDAASAHALNGSSGVVVALGAAATADTTTGDCTAFGAPEDLATNATAKTLFDYECTYTRADSNVGGNSSLKVVATANANDGGIEGNTLEMLLDLDDGTIERSQVGTSKMFGGSADNV